MKTYNIKITETYSYYIKIDADNQKQAMEKANNYYENADDGYIGVSNAQAFENADIRILKDK